MFTVLIITLVAYLIILIWAGHDAFENTDLGCMWLAGFIFVPILSLIVYVVIRTYASRRVAPSIGYDPREYSRPMKHFGTEIEKARFIEAAMKGGGTMYEPQRRGRQAPQGYRHFADTRADALLGQGQYGQAFEYLIEMYAVALDDKDGRGQDTYLHYIHQLPQGAQLLAQWRRENSVAGDGGSDQPGPAPPQDSREVPF